MNSASPFISVIIPVFNRSWQLRRALESLRDQTFRDFEVIVCDDGSSEDIASVVKDFEGNLNIQVIHMSNWGGPARPRNKGLELSRGQWISFLDSDDWWDLNRLSIMSDYI
ncbi:glycosyltransferase family 2 protein [Polynucleobacter necessarius]|uniref:glycosyltransferase family 2 protein n=1 Tax=Polynucleobacter necessarius TaxID=576610 RepID=UPI000E094091|nr:glycosyltransferase family A protein [Polynucleobacter necessarius]